MTDTRIASKAKDQLANFMGKVFTHFSKPVKRFVEECIYGIQASGDTKLSSIVRAIDDGLRRAFTRFGRWIRAAALTTAADAEPPHAPLLPGFADLFDMDDG